MSHRDPIPGLTIHFYATAPYPCSYLDGLEARSQVAIPLEAIDAGAYAQLVRLGFRRSGLYTYRPYCDRCKACRSVRIPVDAFLPSRTQKRAWRRHAGLLARERPLLFDEAHYALYRRYQAARHAGGSMAEDDWRQYADFILGSRVDSLLVEFAEPDGTVRMVSLIDRLDDGLSAVYTFYDPDVPRASFGVYNVLWQVEAARRLGLDYLYLGYWIEASPKMAYKAGFRPLEVLADGVWRPM